MPKGSGATEGVSLARRAVEELAQFATHASIVVKEPRSRPGHLGRITCRPACDDFRERLFERVLVDEKSPAEMESCPTLIGDQHAAVGSDEFVHRRPVDSEHQRAHTETFAQAVTECLGLGWEQVQPRFVLQLSKQIVFNVADPLLDVRHVQRFQNAFGMQERQSRPLRMATPHSRQRRRPLERRAAGCVQDPVPGSAEIREEPVVAGEAEVHHVGATPGKDIECVLARGHDVVNSPQQVEITDVEPFLIRNEDIRARLVEARGAELLEEDVEVEPAPPREPTLGMRNEVFSAAPSRHVVVHHLVTRVPQALGHDHDVAGETGADIPSEKIGRSVSRHAR